MSFVQTISNSLTASILTLSLASVASGAFTTATYQTGVSMEGLGSFTAIVTYDYSSGTTASLTVLATNTSLASNGGYITGIALTGSGASAVSFVSSNAANFHGLFGSVSANPFGTYQGGASTSSSWEGGGAPSMGLAIGQSALFTFNLTDSAVNFASHTATTILTQVSGSGLVLRFRGFNNGGSDKVSGVVSTTVPAPGVLSAMALLVAFARRRRR